MARINAERIDLRVFELIRWEHAYYTATTAVQDQTPRSSDCDLVVCIFWKRLGSDLPDQYRRKDGSLPTGTEYEFETAREAAFKRRNKVPDILVYRNRSSVHYASATVDLERAQYERLLGFWKRWFESEEGHFTAGFHNYDTLEQFEVQFENHLRQWLARRSGAVVWSGQSPFRGLKPFDVRHAAVFFGRNREVDRIRARFLANASAGIRFLAIVGASGSGKSSVARAGLLDRLSQTGGMGGIAGPAIYAAVTPSSLAAEGRSWRAGLAQALFRDDVLGPGLADGDFTTPQTLEDHMGSSGIGSSLPLKRALARLKVVNKDLATAAGASPLALVILIDQLEEIFSWKRDDAEAFLTFLEQLVNPAGGTIYVVATMRSDFRLRLTEFAPLERLTALSQPLKQGEYERVIDIAAPSGRDLSEIIAGPASAAGLRYESVSGRDLRALIEAEASPQALPALQMLLSELYARREGNELKLRAFDELRGVSGVMAQRGDQILSEAGPGAPAALAPVFRALMVWSGAGQPIAQRVPLDTFEPGSEAHRLAVSMVNAGLLTSEQGMVRVAHESLISGWDRLRNLFADERRLFEIREVLAGLFRQHQATPALNAAKQRERLLTGVHLSDGTDLLEKWGEQPLQAVARGLPDFIRASQARDRTQKRNRLALIACGIALVGVAIGAAGWLIQRRTVAELQAVVQTNLAHTSTALGEGRWDAAVSVAAEAFRLDKNLDTRSRLLEALAERSANHISTVDVEAQAIDWPTTDSLAVVGDGGKLFVYGAAALGDADRTSQTKLKRLSSSAAGDYLAIADDGAILSRSGEAGAQWREILRASGQKLVYQSQSDMRRVGAGFVALATDKVQGTTLTKCASLAAASCRQTIISAGSPVAALSADSTQIAIVTGGPDRPILELRRVSDPLTVSDSRPLAALEGRDAILSLGLSRDAQFAAIGAGISGRAGRLIVVPLDPRVAQTIPPVESSSPVNVLEWSPTSDTLAFSCSQGSICRAAVGPGIDLHMAGPLRDDDSAFTSIRWSPDGALLASNHVGGKVRVWRNLPVEPVLMRRPVGGGASLESVAVDREGGLVAVGTGTGEIWGISGYNLENGYLAVTGDARITHLVFGADGRLAVGDSSGTLRLLEGSPLQLKRDSNIGNEVQRVALAKKTLAASQSSNSIALLPLVGEKAKLVFESTPDGLLGLPDGTLYSSHVDGSIHRRNIETDIDEIAIPGDVVADRGSALSLALDPSGRWLAASRFDDRVKLYDLAGKAPPIELPIFSLGSKTVAFSPSGQRFALLGVEGRLYIWAFDATDARADLILALPAVPRSVFPADAGTVRQRPATWIDWLDSDRIVISSIFGELLALNVNEESWRAALCDVAFVGKPEASLRRVTATPESQANCDDATIGNRNWGSE
ncbi:NACHT and WD repeat domain-containing protein [Kaistia algarum]|uniref:NACHT and WD repeat domain-containing protein n=1 Tax=Kaistia algarum TaxID=2083279 RepID=UPI001402F598|nr:AAA family ATPase [Kaistia algarum]MCX5512997.1 AAA family ATPase [Kaistia algarum]